MSICAFTNGKPVKFANFCVQTYCERVKIWGKIFSVTNMIMK